MSCSDEDMEYRSKTQKKKEASSLQDLGRKIVALSEEQIKGMGLPVELYDAVLCARTIRSRSALRRQMQFIGALMRRLDAAPVQEALRNIERGITMDTARFKEIERWRDGLIAGNEKLLEEIAGKYPTAEPRHILQLVQNARMERDAGKPPSAYRSLFRYLKKISQPNY